MYCLIQICDALCMHGEMTAEVNAILTKMLDNALYMRVRNNSVTLMHRLMRYINMGEMTGQENNNIITTEER